MAIPASVNPEALAHDQAEDIGSARTQRPADTQFVDPLRDRVRNDAVDSRQSEQQRHAGERSQQPDYQTPLPHFLIDQVIHSPDVRNGLIAIQGAHLFAHHWGEAQRVAFGPYGQHGIGQRVLRERDVHALGPDGVFETLMHSGDDADDLYGLQVHAADQQALAYGGPDRADTPAKSGEPGLHR